MANEARDKLIKLLHTIEDHPEKTCPRKEGDSCDGCEYITESGNGCNSIARRADFLIKNGVIAPPCKVGNVVWLIENNSVERATVNKVEITGTSEFRITLKKLNLVGKYVYFQLEQKELGKTIFIGENAKDQAEQKLKEMG